MPETKIGSYDLSLEITAQPEFLSVVRTFVGCLSRELHFSDQETSQLELCIDEACANSIGAIQEVEGPVPKTRLRLEFTVGNNFLKITVQDSGKDFSQNFHKALPMSDITDRTRMRGYGLQIIKTFMDDVQYVRDPSHGNFLHLIKYFNGGREEPRA